MLFEKRNGTLSYLLLHVDVVLLFTYLVFRTEVLVALLSAFDAITPSRRFDQFRFLVWGGVLFVTCTACSYFRQSHFAIPTNTSRGIVFFELMVLGAVALSVGRSLSQSAAIDPFWVVNLSLLNYGFEIVTTAGAGYVFADFLSRIRFIFLKV